METVQLQGIGKCKAVPACQLVPGMVILWNYGYKSIVTAVQLSGTGKSMIIETESIESGKRYTKRTTINRLFAIEQNSL